MKLTVVGQAGQSDSSSLSLQITSVPEVVPPTAVIERTIMAFAGYSVTSHAANSKQGTADITQCQWQIGEGNNHGPGADSSFTTINSQPGVLVSRGDRS